MSARLRADLALEGTKVDLWAQGGTWRVIVGVGGYSLFTDGDQVAALHFGAVLPDLIWVTSFRHYSEVWITVLSPGPTGTNVHRFGTADHRS